MHVIISTHKLGELPAVLESIRQSGCVPQSVVVSCDGRDEELAGFIRQARPRLNWPLVLMQRTHKGVARRGQTRNNGVRAIRGFADASDMLYFLDGDVCPDAGHFQAIAQAGPADVLIGRVARLSPNASETLRSRLLKGERFTLPVREQLAFTRKVAKAKVTCGMRRLNLPGLRGHLPAYWPDLRSGNFAVRASAFFQVNGFDEALVGWGAEDSDLGLRLYRAGARVTTFPWGCRAYHLWHPSDASAARLQARLSPFGYKAQHGLESPFEQADAELHLS